LLSVVQVLSSLPSSSQTSGVTPPLPCPCWGQRAREKQMPCCLLWENVMKDTTDAEATIKTKDPSSSAPYHYLSSPRAFSSLQEVPCTSPPQVKLSSLLSQLSLPRMGTCACWRWAGLTVWGGGWGSKPSPASAAA